MNNTLMELMTPKTGRHVGDLVRWGSLKRVDQDTAIAAAIASGLDNDLVFPNVSPTNAYKRAVRDAVANASTDERKWTVAKVQDDRSATVHQFHSKLLVLSNETQLSEMGAEYHHEVAVRFVKTNLSSKDPLSCIEAQDWNHPICRAVRERYNEILTSYSSSDLRAAFNRAFESWHGVHLSFGLWFVPAASVERVRAWSEFLSRVNCGSIVLPQFDSEETINGLQEIASEALDAQLEKLREELVEFTKRDNIRVSTLESRVESFDELMAKATAYETILEMNLQQLKEQVFETRNALVDSLGNMTAG